jgi:hypothetical protein
MSNEDMAKAIIKHAKNYHKNLENRNLLFIYKTPTGFQIEEVSYHAKNFMHLTGVEPKANTFGIRMSPTKFYNLAVDGKLRGDQFIQKPFAEDKMNALEVTMFMHENARKIGIGKKSDFGVEIYFETASGNNRAFIGYVIENKGDYDNVPITNCNVNINSAADKKYPVYAIARKNISDKLYSEITYISPDYNKKLTNEIKNKLTDSTNKILQNIVRVKNLKISDFKITRSIDDREKFTVMYDTLERTYSLRKGDVKEETLKSIADDFGVTSGLAEDIFDTADNISILDKALELRAENETEFSEELTPQIPTNEQSELDIEDTDEINV